MLSSKSTPMHRNELRIRKTTFLELVRRDRGLSQSALARKIGCHVDTIRRIERYDVTGQSSLRIVARLEAEFGFAYSVLRGAVAIDAPRRSS
jgi:ribosome-binding protein aMBF1 (putative translation factor)